MRDLTLTVLQHFSEPIECMVPVQGVPCHSVDCISGILPKGQVLRDVQTLHWASGPSLSSTESVWLVCVCAIQRKQGATWLSFVSLEDLKLTCKLSNVLMVDTWILENCIFIDFKKVIFIERKFENSAPLALQTVHSTHILHCHTSMAQKVHFRQELGPLGFQTRGVGRNLNDSKAIFRKECIGPEEHSGAYVLAERVFWSQREEITTWILNLWTTHLLNLKQFWLQPNLGRQPYTEGGPTIQWHKSLDDGDAKRARPSNPLYRWQPGTSSALRCCWSTERASGWICHFDWSLCCNSLTILGNHVCNWWTWGYTPSLAHYCLVHICRCNQVFNFL